MQYLEYLKEAWKDPRKKAIIKLGLYIAFFAIMFMIAGLSSSNSVPNVIEQEEKKEIYNNYSFIVSLNNQPMITGVFDNNVITYNYSNQIFKLENELLYQVINNELVNIDNTHTKLDKLMLNKIDSYIEKSTEIYKTNYNDGKEKIGYQININDFSTIYESKEQFSDEKIQVGITYLDNKIIEIEYDLTNYYNNGSYILNFTFDNFNQSQSLY